MNYSWLSACQGEVEPFKGALSTHGRLTSLRNKRSPGNFQHQYLPEVLVNVYVYRLIVKSVSCCCVRASQLFSNPVTCIDEKFNLIK